MTLDCPKCGTEIDRFDENHSRYDVNDDGRLWEIIEQWKQNGGWEGLNIEVECAN